MGGARITDDEKFDVLYFRKNGASFERIAENMGIKEQRVRYIIKMHKESRPWYIKLMERFGMTYDK